jgi:chromosomal replication initiation ATPase DnaA
MTIIEAMRASAKRHGVSEGDVLGHTRKLHIVKARWAGWAKAVEAGHTRADIARAVGKDWTSVMHGVRRYNEGKDT